MIDSLHQRTCNGGPIGELRPVRRRRGHRLRPRRPPLPGGRRHDGRPRRDELDGASSSLASARAASGHRPRPPARRVVVAAPDGVTGGAGGRPRRSPREHGGKKGRGRRRRSVVGVGRALYIPGSYTLHTRVWCTNVCANVSGRVYERGREMCYL
jgi:hypothetical protein